MPADGPFTDEDIAALKQKFNEGGSGQVFVLEHDQGVTFTPPESVLFLAVPAEGACGFEPDLEWRSGALREAWPEAVGVSQCALAPDHPTPQHVGVLFVRTGGVDRTRTYATQVPFPRDVDGG